MLECFLLVCFCRLMILMYEVPKVMNLVMALALVSPVLSVTGCGGGGGPVELQTYEPITEEEKKVVEEKMERLKDEPRG